MSWHYPDSWYFRYGDYAEVSYRGLGIVTPRVRYGTLIDFDDRVSNADSHNWEVALLSRLDRHLLLLAQYQFNMEEVAQYAELVRRGQPSRLLRPRHTSPYR